jgi:hypothetical protein
MSKDFYNERRGKLIHARRLAKAAAKFVNSKGPNKIKKGKVVFV